LIKAPHLRNSTTFTIVDLKEYHVQNYNDEISQIIEHANTELKYETIYRSIQAEWEKLDLKIIPFRESDDSYLMVNTDTLSNAIEENLTTLESLSQS
jgi:archaellum component FlaC